jgi:hypothetical protein
VTQAEAAARLPDPLAGSNDFPVLVEASFLLEDEGRLRTYAEVMGGVSSATLVIDASAMPEEAAARQLQALVERCGLADDDGLSMIGLIGTLEASQRFRVRTGIRARYGAGGPAGEADAPAFAPGSLAELRELAEGRL